MGGGGDGGGGEGGGGDGGGEHASNRLEPPEKIRPWFESSAPISFPQVTLNDCVGSAKVKAVEWAICSWVKVMALVGAFAFPA